MAIHRNTPESVGIIWYLPSGEIASSPLDIGSVCVALASWPRSSVGGEEVTVADAGPRSLLSRSPTRAAMLKAEALEDSTGRAVLVATRGAVAPGVGDFGEGLGPPILQVGVGLGVSDSLDEPGEREPALDVGDSTPRRSIERMLNIFR